MDETDEQLARRAQRGCTEAVSALFARHWPGACRTARVLCDSDTAAEDIAQDALVRAFTRLHRYDPARPFTPWLRRVVVNTALNGRRAMRPTAPLHAGLAAPGVDVHADLLAAVDALPPDRRTVVALRFGLDLTPSEIAEALGLPVGTVNSRLARALTDLRARLEVVG